MSSVKSCSTCALSEGCDDQTIPANCCDEYMSDDEGQYIPRLDVAEARRQADRALTEIEMEESGWYAYNGEGQLIRKESDRATTR